MNCLQTTCLGTSKSDILFLNVFLPFPLYLLVSHGKIYSHLRYQVEGLFQYYIIVVEFLHLGLSFLRECNRLGTVTL